MFRRMLSSKIHRATVTETELSYEGSIAIDRVLIDAAGMIPSEMVYIFNINNGARFETYIIEAPENSGIISLNGAAARQAQVGDKVIIISSKLVSEEYSLNHSPKVIKVDERNKIID